MASGTPSRAGGEPGRPAELGLDLGVGATRRSGHRGDAIGAGEPGGDAAGRAGTERLGGEGDELTEADRLVVVLGVVDPTVASGTKAGCRVRSAGTAVAETVDVVHLVVGGPVRVLNGAGRLELISPGGGDKISGMDVRYSRQETALRESADQDLGAFAVTRAATGKLAEAIDGAFIPLAPEPAPPEWYLRAAILNLCVVGLRSSRACMSLIACGYEPEAQGLKRRVMEVCARIGAVLEDESGEHARLWLEGKPPSTPRKIAGKFTSLALFDLYSESAHVDGRRVLGWLAVPMPEVGPHHKGLITTPERRPAHAKVMLVELAHECRDLAVIMARSRGVGTDLTELDDEIVAARDR